MVSRIQRNALRPAGYIPVMNNGFKERGGPYGTKIVPRRIEEGDMIVEEQEMRRGEIYHADLNPVFGVSRADTAPC